MIRDPQRLSVELQRLEWARQLSPDVIDEILAAADFASYAPGEAVLSIDDTLTDVYFVIEGRLEGLLLDHFDKQVERQEFVRGSVLGVFSGVLPERSRVQLSALEPTAVMHVPLDTLLRLMTKHRAFQLAMLAAAANVVKRLVVVKRDLPKPSVVGVVHQTAGRRHVTAQLTRRLQQLDETVCVAGDEQAGTLDAGIPYKPLYEGGRMLAGDAVTAILKEWSSAGRLLIDVRADRSLDDLKRLLSYADVVLWCTSPTDADDTVRQLQIAVRDAPWLRDKVRIVWDLAEDAAAPPYIDNLSEIAAGDFKIHATAPPPPWGKLLERGLERIVHHLRGVQIGLALGGGAARGMAHLGVLKSLEQQGIFVDRIAGTSAGAMTGTVYAAGMDPEYATQRFKTDLQPGWLFRKLPAGGYWYLMYKYRFHQFDSMLRKYLHNLRLEQLAIPMTTMAVDLVDGGLLERRVGDATQQILESINLPPLALPLVNQGRAVVDGGLLNNVPANVLVEQGCNFVIASTVTAKLEQDFMAIRSGRSKRSGRFFPTLQVMMRQHMVQSHHLNAVGVRSADLVIAPDVTSFDLSEFTRADEMAVVGEAATEQCIGKLKTMLRKLDPQLFR